MKLIPLTQGKSAIVDDEDYEYLMQWKWYVAKGYAIRNVGQRPNRTRLFMHRGVAKTLQGMETDHINGNTLDNRRVNLRVCTRSENARNRCKNSNNTSGFKGVNFHKETRKWAAHIRLNKRLIHLGLFSTPETAHAAYCDAAIKHYGEFVRTS